MSIRNSIKILFNNFMTVWKILLYKIIVFFISVALLAGFVLPNIITILNNIADTGLFDNIKNIVDAFFTRTDFSQNIEALKTSMESSSKVLTENAYRLVLSYFYISLILVFGNMLSGLSDLASSDVINGDMSANAKYGFLSRFIITLGRNIKYQALRLVTEIPVYIIIITISWHVFSFLFNYIAVFALFFAFIIFILLLSLSQAFFCCWLSEITVEKTGVAKAIKTSFLLIKPIYINLLSSYAIINIFLLFANIMLAFFTCGAGLIVSIPMSTLFLVIYRLVVYYELKGLKYYTDGNTIITPVKNSEEFED